MWTPGSNSTNSDGITPQPPADNGGAAPFKETETAAPEPDPFYGRASDGDDHQDDAPLTGSSGSDTLCGSAGQAFGLSQVHGTVDPLPTGQPPDFDPTLLLTPSEEEQF